MIMFNNSVKTMRRALMSMTAAAAMVGVATPASAYVLQ
jgi:hypothetical protein